MPTVCLAASVGPWSFPWSLGESISRHLRAPQSASHASHHLRAPRFPPSSPVSPITGKCRRGRAPLLRTSATARRACVPGLCRLAEQQQAAGLEWIGITVTRATLGIRTAKGGDRTTNTRICRKMEVPSVSTPIGLALRRAKALHGRRGWLARAVRRYSRPSKQATQRPFAVGRDRRPCQRLGQRLRCAKLALRA
jgi:hypothetical protein